MNMQTNIQAGAIDWTFDTASVAELFRQPAIQSGKVRVYRNDLHVPRISVDYNFSVDQLRCVLAFLFSESRGDGLMLYGPFGCGKTSLIREILGRLHYPTLMLSWNESSDTADLIGKTGMAFGNTEFEPGPLTLAVKYGYALVINEVDRGRAGNLVALNDLLDGGNLVIKETNEVIIPHPNFRLICTANSAGSGDLTGAYTGSVRKLDPAFIDRFLMLQLDYMSLEQETDLLLRQFPQYADASGAFVADMCAFAAETRQKATDYADVLTMPLSTRGLVRFFHYGLTMGLVSKLKAGTRSAEQLLPLLALSYLNRLSPEEREAAETLFKLKTGCTGA